jgi:hypothetical protein
MLVFGQPPDNPQDWETLLPVARAQNLLPILHKKMGGNPAVPDTAQNVLRGAYMRSAARAALMQHELAKLLGLFGAAGAEVILLKGSALAAAIYPDPALRPMSDVDVLITRDQLEPALGCTRQMGFAPDRDEARPGDALKFENELAMVNTSTAMTMIEFHWDLFNSTHHQNKMQMSWFWQSAVPITLNKTPAKMLGPEAQLLHLCSHLMLHHHGEGLLWWNDIFEVLNKLNGQINWDLALAKAQEFDLVLPLQRVVLQLADGWGAPVPAPVRQRLAQAQATPREAQVFGWLTSSAPPANRLAADLSGLPTWNARVRFALSNLFPSPGYMRRRYAIKHTALVPLAYPYRWFIGIRDALTHKP